MKMPVRYGVNIFAFEVDEVGVGADGAAFPEVCEGCEVWEGLEGVAVAGGVADSV